MPATHHSSSPPASSTGEVPVPPAVGEPAPEPPSAGGTTAVGRIPVLDVRPLVLDGRRPAKAVVGESFEVSATVFREG
ncbi:maltotransferase domain-containing protein, partial [Streptomyces glaucus]|uniref:maltotransferase domain-containing protein n=1 Tax=Streptomyces glaucus TaxID=284029 RepID=UPI0031D21EA9